MPKVSYVVGPCRNKYILVGIYSRAVQVFKRFLVRLVSSVETGPELIKKSFCLCMYYLKMNISMMDYEFHEICKLNFSYRCPVFHDLFMIAAKTTL